MKCLQTAREFALFAREKSEKMFKIKLIFQQFNLRKLLRPSWLTFLWRAFDRWSFNWDIADVINHDENAQRKKFHFSHIR